MKKKVIIIALVLVVLIGLFFIAKTFIFKPKRHHVADIDKTFITKDSIVDTTSQKVPGSTTAVSTVTGNALVGKWQRIKEVDPEGTVKLDKNCNVINYKVNIAQDNSFIIEFDRTDNPSSGAHKTKYGTWKMTKSTEAGFQYDLTLLIIKPAGGTNEKVNKIISLNNGSLISVDPEGNTQYFSKYK